MEEESDGLLGTRADWSKPLGFKMGLIVEGGGILTNEDHRFLSDSAAGRVIVGRKDGLHVNLRMIEKPIARLGFGSAPTDLGDIASGTGIEISDQGK